MGITRSAMGLGLRALNRMAGSEVVDRLGLRKPAASVIYGASRAGFASAGAMSRAFRATRALLQPQRPAAAELGEWFDLAPTEEQRLLRETCRSFAEEQLRPAALQADAALGARPELLAAASELGLAQLGIPEHLGGVGNDRAAVTQCLVNEALGYGDLSLAVACLAPMAVSQALVLWGSAEQQSRYLPAFVSAQSPVAALAIQEPAALFDPLHLTTRARRTPDGYVLEGSKALVPRGASCELFVIAAHLEGRGPALFLVESSTAGLSIQAEPAMGLRAAATARVQLDKVQLSLDALLGGADAGVYAACLSLSRLAWCALAVGTSQAALDYLLPYVNERVAFGEPISHRQSVAFGLAQMAIDVDAMRLLTWRAASRAEQGLPFIEQAAQARVLCAERAMDVGSQAVQLLGGHGFVKEHPAERWYRDLRATGFMEGALLI